MKDDLVGKLNKRIREGDVSVTAALSDLPSRCVEDSDQVTPFATAIGSYNSTVISLLLEDEQTLEYHPSFDDEQASDIKMMLGGDLRGSLEDTEKFLIGNRYVENSNWRRTPLLEACRAGNEEAIRALVIAGADLSPVDVLSQSALDLCLHQRSDGPTLALLESCAAADRQCPVNDRQLEAAVRRTNIWESLQSNGRLNAKAKHFVFNLACARLDIDTVERMIAEKYKPQSAVSYHSHPMMEAATSHFVFVQGLPDFSDLAPGFAHMYGHPDAMLMSSDNLFDDDGNPISFAKAELRNRRKSAALKWKDEDPTFVSDESLRKRMALLELLSEKGMVPGKYGENAIEQLTATNRPEFLTRFAEFGFETTNPSEDDIDHALHHKCRTMAKALQAMHKDSPPQDELPEATWELPAESGISARFPDKPAAGVTTTLEVIFDNIYGPLDGVEVFVRIGNPVNATPYEGFDTVDDWQTPTLKQETVFLDDAELPRSEVEEPLCTEAPWRAQYVIDLQLSFGPNRIEIGIISKELEELDGVYGDWIVNAE